MKLGARLIVAVALELVLAAALSACAPRFWHPGAAANVAKEGIYPGSGAGELSQSGGSSTSAHYITSGVSSDTTVLSQNTTTFVVTVSSTHYKTTGGVYGVH